MPEEKTIYDLDLHERIGGPDGFITRVPGGWIYELTSSSKMRNATDGYSAVFVPMNTEFKSFI